MSQEQIRESIEAARRYLADHPDEARSKDRSATAVLEEGLRCRVEGPDGATVVSDMPTAVGGAASAPTPGWLARAALASCDATVIALRAAELGIHLERLEVTVDSESDDRGLLGVGDAPPGPLGVRVRVRLRAKDVGDETVRDLLSWVERHSPVGGIFRHGAPTTIEVETAAAAISS